MADKYQVLMKGLYMLEINNKKGVVLVFILMAAVFGGIIAYSFFITSSTSYRHESLRGCDTQAMKTTDSGINYALYKLNEGFSLDIGFSITLTGTDNKGDFSVTLTRIDEELYKANSTGTYIAGPQTCSHQIEAYIIKRIKSIFTYGLFSDRDLTFVGNPLVDSYNSDNGPYSGQATNVDPEHGVTYANANGDIGTNKNITLTGNTLIYGDASYGPGGTIFYGTGSYIAGTTSQLEEKLVLPSFDFPPAPPENNNDLIPPQIYNPQQQKIKITQGSHTLPSGTYYVKDLDMSGNSSKLRISDNSTLYITNSLSMVGGSQLIIGDNVTIVVVGKTAISGNAQITVNGMTTFYGGGDFSITGNGFVNTMQKPDQLQIYLSTNSTTTQDKVTFSGNADYYGTLYAPYAYVHIGGNAATYGSIIGGEIKYNGNASFHYDEDLANVKFGFQYWSIASWVKIK